MRPPDDLSSLKHLPLVLGAAGAFVVPAMWAFVLDKPALISMSVVMGSVFLASGLYLKYRARYSPREALWAAVLALLFFGSLLVVSTTALAWRAQRQDMQALALGLAGLMWVCGMTIGFVAERRRMRVMDAVTGLPAPLAPLVDMQRHRVLPLPSPPPPRAATVAALTALVLNVPLLLQIGGLGSQRRRVARHARIGCHSDHGAGIRVRSGAGQGAGASGSGTPRGTPTGHVASGRVAGDAKRVLVVPLACLKTAGAMRSVERCGASPQCSTERVSEPKAQTRADIRSPPA